jgi:hypothetical protein
MISVRLARLEAAAKRLSPKEKEQPKSFNLIII